MLFLYLKEKARKRSKQTCGLIACAALTELRTLLFMIFDMDIENLKAREGDYGGTRKTRNLFWKRFLGIPCSRSYDGYTYTIEIDPRLFSPLMVIGIPLSFFGA